MTEFVNLTPHTICIMDREGAVIREIPPSGTVARVQTRTILAGEIDGIPVVEHTFGDVKGLPLPRRDTVYLVSSLVLSAVEDREDVLAPDTSAESVVRDEAGRIIGVRRLQRPRR